MEPAQVEELRLSERDFDNLGQIGDGQFGSVCSFGPPLCLADYRSLQYDVNSMGKYTP